MSTQNKIYSYSKVDNTYVYTNTNNGTYLVTRGENID
jgi:hypothetical protein